MDWKVLIAPLAGLIICFITTYFTTETTITGALTIAITTAVSVFVVNVIVERAKRIANARLQKHIERRDSLAP